jgi:sporulation protein YlmC with PRC-barrel domain
MRKIKKYLKEENEQDVDVPENNVSAIGNPVARKASDSVDDQIDSLILMYEKNSVRKNETISEALRNLSLRILLKEQDEEAGTDDTPAEPEEEPEPTEPTGSEEMTAEPAIEQKVPDLDIDQFTIDIARLILNKESLLDIDTAIINRTKNFLNDNYGDAFVRRFLDTLQEQFGLTSQEFDVDYSSVDAPFAIGANPAGAGSVGG